MTRQVRGSYIQGQFLHLSDGNGEVKSRNPGDLEQPAVSFVFSYEHVQESVVAAKRAFSTWRRIAPSDRYAALRRYQELLQARREELASALSWELGIPLWESSQEMTETLDVIENFIQLGSQTIQKESTPPVEGVEGSVRYHPRGVIAVIAPAVQASLLTHAQIVPLLLNGNTVVLQGAPNAPYFFQCLAECLHDASLPSGVINVIHGEWEVTRRLIGHGDVEGVFFTGPQEIAAKIQKQLHNDYWKISVLDAGGKNAILVWDDAPYEKALYDSLYACFVTSGQRPTAGDRILVHEKIYDKFIEDFHVLAKRCRVDYGFKTGVETPFLGPLANEETLEHYLRFQGIAVREGCEELMRGKPLERSKRGYYVSPSIHLVAKADPKSIYQKNEVVGPNAGIFKISDLDQATEIINATPYGLVASLYSKSRIPFQRLSDELRVGMINLNLPTTTFSHRLPYGGIKHSGNSRPMGSFSGHQATYPVSTLEFSGNFDKTTALPHLPKLEGN